MDGCILRYIKILPHQILNKISCLMTTIILKNVTKLKFFLLLHAHVIGHAGMSHDIYILFDDNKMKTWS